jgi:hypothetical protein
MNKQRIRAARAMPTNLRPPDAGTRWRADVLLDVLSRARIGDLLARAGAATPVIINGT